MNIYKVHYKYIKHEEYSEIISIEHISDYKVLPKGASGYDYILIDNYAYHLSEGLADKIEYSYLIIDIDYVTIYRFHKHYKKHIQKFIREEKLNELI